MTLPLNRFSAKISRVLSLLLFKLLVFFAPFLLGSDLSSLLLKLLGHFIHSIREEDSRVILKILLNFCEDDAPLTNQQLDKIVNFSAHERDAWVQNELGMIPSGARVLDAGAGQCRYKPFLMHTQYETQDFAQYKGNEKGPLKESWDYGKLNYICDINQIPVEDARFDTVLCTEVLEHVPDPISAMKELIRVLSPGGTLIITVPLGSGVHQEPYHFYGGFSPYFFKHYLHEFGMDLMEIKPIGGLLKHVAQESHRVSDILAGCDKVNSHGLYLLREWLPRTLYDLDGQFLVEQFTVGYLIKARKGKVS